MSTTKTTNLELVKDNADEAVRNFRTHTNSNMDTIDTAIKAVQDATTTLEAARQNLNALMGTLGMNGSTPLIDAATARTNLDAAQSESASGSLYDSEQAIISNTAAIGNVDVTTDGSLQSQVSSIRDSLSEVLYRESSSSTSRGVFLTRVHKVVSVHVYLTSANLSTSWKTFAQLPAGSRPQYAIYAAGGNAMLSVDTGGDIALKALSNSANEVTLSLTFIAA